MMPVIPRTVAYLRVSTREQDLEKNKADILMLANRREFGHVGFVGVPAVMEQKTSIRYNCLHEHAIHSAPTTQPLYVMTTRPSLSSCTQRA